MSYQKNTGQACLDLFEGDTILDTHDLTLHWNGVFKTFKNDVRQFRNDGKAVVGGIGHKRVENFISGSTQLIVGVVPEKR